MLQPTTSEPTNQHPMPDEATKRVCRKCKHTIYFRHTGITLRERGFLVCGYKFCRCGVRKPTNFQQRLWQQLKLTREAK